MTSVLPSASVSTVPLSASLFTPLQTSVNVKLSALVQRTQLTAAKIAVWDGTLRVPKLRTQETAPYNAEKTGAGFSVARNALPITASGVVRAVLQCVHLAIVAFPIRQCA